MTDGFALVVLVPAALALLMLLPPNWTWWKATAGISIIGLIGLWQWWIAVRPPNSPGFALGLEAFIFGLFCWGVACGLSARALQLGYRWPGTSGAGFAAGLAGILLAAAPATLIILSE